MKEKDPIRKAPNLIPASERNIGMGKNVFLTRSLLEEIQIRKTKSAIFYKIIPQMFLSPTSLKIAISLVENDMPVVSKIQKIQTDMDYRIEDRPIKIKFKRGDSGKIAIRIKAHGYEVVYCPLEE